MDKEDNNNSIPSPQEVLKMAANGGSVDRSQLGIDTPKTSDGLQSFNEGFDFLQHGDSSMKSLNE